MGELLINNERKSIMSISTVSKLHGNISVSEVQCFLTEYLKKKGAKNIHVKNDVKGHEIHCEDISFVKEFYRPDKKWIDQYGYIIAQFTKDDAENASPSNMVLFYSKSSINSYENLEFYQEISSSLVRMAKTETTYISASCTDEYKTMLRSITEHFGGWFFPCDCDEDKYEEFKPSGVKTVKRIDVMTDIETLGKTADCQIIQIAAVAFDIRTGNTLEKINIPICCEPQMIVDANTLKWWLKTDKDLLVKLLEEGDKNQETEREALCEFKSWLEELPEKYGLDIKDLYLWGNGILFDNRLIKEKMEKYKLTYPIFYRNDRDMRTIVECAALKNGQTSEEFRNTVGRIGTAHDAFDDVLTQIQVVSRAFNEVVY